MTDRIPVICGYARSPLGLARGGSLGIANHVHIAGPVVKASLDRTGLTAADIKRSRGGCGVQSNSGGINVWRRVVNQGLGASGNHIYGSTVNASCDSGLEVIVDGAQDVMNGHDFVLVGGVDVNSDGMSPPGSDASPTVTSPNPLISLKNMWKIISLGTKYGGDLNKLADKLLELTMPFDQALVTMLNSGDFTADMMGYTREALDEYAYEIHKRAILAQGDGIFNEELVTVHLPNKKGYVDIDETIRTDTTKLALSKLKPARRGGKCTAGNSSKVAVGAASLIVADEKAALEHGIPILARIKGWALTGGDTGIRQLLTPGQTVKQALNHAGLLATEDLLDDKKVLEASAKVGYWEVNGAFASVVKYVQDTYGIPLDRLNLDGDAIALGHPFAASGTRLTGHAALRLQRMKEQYAAITLCVAQGLGGALILERWEPSKTELKTLSASADIPQSNFVPRLPLPLESTLRTSLVPDHASA